MTISKKITLSTFKYYSRYYYFQSTETGGTSPHLSISLSNTAIYDARLADSSLFCTVQSVSFFWAYSFHRDRNDTNESPNAVIKQTLIEITVKALYSRSVSDHGNCLDSVETLLQSFLEEIQTFVLCCVADEDTFDAGNSHILEVPITQSFYKLEIYKGSHTNSHTSEVPIGKGARSLGASLW
ncbi:hypothetical protein J6590_024205 [Homalodisca vitripennis]|nr:hypothetical protein J6590_024205 [Homalodisca vitripennis]